MEGTLIRVEVDRCPATGARNLGRTFAAFCRHFDAEHTSRFLKQTLGWTRPRIRTPAQAGRWTWLVLAAYTQLRLARHLAEDLRRPWQPPLPVDRLTASRVRRGFPPGAPAPANGPKPVTAGPAGRQDGNQHSHAAFRSARKSPKPTR